MRKKKNCQCQTLHKSNYLKKKGNLFQLQLAKNWDVLTSILRTKIQGKLESGDLYWTRGIAEATKESTALN